MEKFKDIHILRWEEIPDFPLYIDQVITLIEKSLSFLSEEKGEKIITSTMINNYVKNGIVEAPIKKRYTRSQVAYFIVICLYKRVYSLDEIAHMIQIQLENSKLEIAYNNFCNIFENLLKDVYEQKDLFSDKKITDIFHKTIISVVFKVYIQSYLLEKFPSEEKSKKKKS
ncbi:MAG: DUF1836 domain-containing protein [Eggerthia catenaformis]|uniref:DUF1836 domain-containing protein n=1 Tax=Eggerthia catenaformis TaxID=31973 RepID=UPI00248E464F|nr:DUF1836 domain-containing protein [Eggerthia catenaformis]